MAPLNYACLQDLIPCLRDRISESLGVKTSLQWAQLFIAVHVPAQLMLSIPMLLKSQRRGRSTNSSFKIFFSLVELEQWDNTTVQIS